MPACPEFEELILDRAAGALDAAGQARLTAHLSGCAACAEEEQTTREALEHAALAQPSAEELAALEGLEGSVRTGWRRAAARRVWLRRSAAALLAAAAAVLLVLPSRSRPPEDGTAPAVAAGADGEAVESWTASDPLTETFDGPAAETELPGQATGDIALADPQTTVDLFLNPGE